jgi:hypothetical protein
MSVPAASIRLRESSWWLVGAAGLTALAGIGASSNEAVQIATLVSSIILSGLLVVLRRVRGRELIIWLVVLVAAFNFAPALFSPLSLRSQSIELRLVKDLPVLVLLVAGFATIRHPDLPRGVRGWLLGWTAVFGVSLLLAQSAENPTASVLVSLRYYILYPMAGIALWRLNLADAERRRVLMLIVAVGIIVAIIAIVEFMGFLGQTYYEGYSEVGGRTFPRSISTLGNPNNLGLFLGLPVVIVISLLQTRTALSKRTGVLMLGILAVGIATSLSKATVPALGLTYVLGTRYPQGKVARYVLAAVLSIGFVWLALDARTQGDINAQTLFGARLDQNEEGFRIFQATPKTFLIGAGPGSQETLDESGEVVSRITDNMILRLLLETGVVGAIAFSALLISAFRAVTPTKDWRSSAMRSWMMFVLLFSPFYANFRLFPASLLFWLAPALAGYAGQRKRTSMPQVQRDRTGEPTESSQAIDG